MFKALAILAALALGAWTLDLLALWLESRGWIYWRKRPRTEGGAMAGLLTEFQKVIEPEMKHVIEAKEERRVERLILPAEDPGGKSGAGGRGT